jgi:anti-sigma factor ChrR (cupin superfamily)
MIVHQTLDDEARDRAALHALGSLDPAESAAYEVHLKQCAVCRREVLSFRETIEQIPLIVPPVAPAESLRQRVLERVRATARELPAAAQTWKTWRPSDRDQAVGFSVDLAQDAVWEPTGVAGVETRRLFVDRANDRATMLIRMAPGASYPSHVHANAEECYVIEGDLRVAETHLKAGDYQRAGSGSLHPIQSTDHGCLLLIVSSLHDELVPHTPPQL